jgi:hypothetical protein
VKNKKRGLCKKLEFKGGIVKTELEDIVTRLQAGWFGVQV